MAFPLNPPQQCTQNNTVWVPARFPFDCVRTCDNNPNLSACQRDITNPGCECKDGFVRNKGGCIPIDSCNACDGNTCPECCEVSATGAPECVEFNIWTLTCSNEKICSGSPDDNIPNCPNRSDIGCVGFGTLQFDCFVADAPGICVIENTNIGNCNDNSECADGEVCIDIDGNGCCPLPFFPNPLGPGVPCPKKCFRVLKEEEIICGDNEFLDPTTNTCLPIPICENGTVFNECGPGDCGRCFLDGTTPICNALCTPGCYCPDGSVSLDNICIGENICVFFRYILGVSRGNSAKTQKTNQLLTQFTQEQGNEYPYQYQFNNNLSELQLIGLGIGISFISFIILFILICLILRFIFKYKCSKYTYNKGYNTVSHKDIEFQSETITDYSTPNNIK